MDILGRILLEVRAHDPDLDISVGRRHREAAARAEGLVVLGDLVRLRIVRIEIVLAVEDRAAGDLATEREPELDRLLDRALVRHSYSARERQTDMAGLRGRCAAE